MIVCCIQNNQKSDCCSTQPKEALSKRLPAAQVFNLGTPSIVQLQVWLSILMIICCILHNQKSVCCSTQPKEALSKRLPAAQVFNLGTPSTQMMYNWGSFSTGNLKRTNVVREKYC